MPDYPRLREPILLSCLAILCWSLALRGAKLPEWVRFVLTGWGILFTAWAFVTAFNWLTFNGAERLKELGLARTYPAAVLAQALRGLTTQQTDIVARHDVATLIGLLGSDAGPQWTLRCIGGDVPWEFAADFLAQSQETEPFLWPVREAEQVGDWPNAENLAKMLTDTIVGHGWAERASGTHAARLRVPLEVIQKRLGI